MPGKPRESANRREALDGAGCGPAPNPMREITLPGALEADETEAYVLNAVFTLTACCLSPIAP
jgi:hypothetical protein